MLKAGKKTRPINTGQTISFRCKVSPNESAGRFYISQRCNLKGNISSLLTGDSTVLNDLTQYTRPFYELFMACTRIVSVDEDFLPATILTNNCYNSMFYSCTNLVNAPKLPATTLTSGCYYNMFNGCSSLTTAPELPATTLASGCYKFMFYSCTSLASAPVLPATTLADNCYSYMFNGCTKLNYIKMLATNVSANDCLHYWVKGVSNTGTFVKNPAMNSLWTASNYNDYAGIPEGWTVVNDGEESGGNLITFYIADSVSVRPNFIEYTAIEGMTWSEWINSEYNTSDLYIDGEYVLILDGLGITGSSGSSVRSSNVIINGEQYRLG